MQSAKLSSIKKINQNNLEGIAPAGAVKANGYIESKSLCIYIEQTYFLIMCLSQTQPSKHTSPGLLAWDKVTVWSSSYSWEPLIC